MKVEVSAYYQNPARNWKREFDNLENAFAEARKYSDITVYVEAENGETWKHGPNEPLKKL
jgi:sugar phosphate isomerase/epimerase